MDKASYHKKTVHSLFVPADFLPALVEEALKPNRYAEYAKVTWRTGEPAIDDPLGQQKGLYIEFSNNSVAQFGCWGREGMLEMAEKLKAYAEDEDNWY